MTKTYMVHYGEIALKGKNRPDFEFQLIRNIEAQHPGATVKRLRGRLTVRSPREIELGDVFGIAWWAEAEAISSSLSAIRSAVVERAVEQASGVRTFAVRVTRGDKILGLTSQQLEVDFGSAVQGHTNLEVDLEWPELTIFVEILEGMSYLYTRRRDGLRGLPVGVSGTLVGLFSGGIDSAVAAYLMSKRGASLELLHFHAYGNPKRAYEGKVGRLARVLLNYVPAVRLHVVPYAGFQLATAGLDRDQRQELVVFRRFMVRVAEQVAREVDGLGLFTGDNLGQVASQTMENLAAVQEVTRLPIYRPLIAYDKQEIIDLGAAIGVAETANEPYRDCCSIIARNPATRANLERVEALEGGIGVAGLVQSTARDRISIEFTQQEPSGKRVGHAEQEGVG